MRVLKGVSLGIAAAMVLSVALFPTGAATQQNATPAAISEVELTLDPSRCQVHFIVDTTLHTVHGTFALKSGSIRFNPATGKADGEVVVYAPSGESGNNSRDKRMHKEILETNRYPDVIFRPTQIDGKIAQSGTTDVKLKGVFSIHGADHNLTAQVHANLMGDHWTGTAKLEIPYIEWGIKDPSNFLLKVQPVVDVELEMSGAIKNAN